MRYRMRPTDGQSSDGLVVFRWLRLAGVGWVCLSLPVVSWAASYADTPRSYVLVFVVLACGFYTTPGLVVGVYAFRRVPADARPAFGVLYLGLALLYAIGWAMLAGLAFGWTWANVLGVPAVAVCGMAHIVGLAMLVRTRSGRRALSVDIVEAVAAVVAVTAPLVVLWWPAVVGAEHAWFTVPAALTLVFTVAGLYWTAVLCVRLGSRKSPFVLGALALAGAGSVNAALQTAQGVSGFTLPAPPLIALTCLTLSLYLLVPLHAPELLPPGLSRLPPQAQVRGTRLATVVGLVGLGALLVATALVADERPWTVAFALGVVSLLFVLAAVRQLAAFGETRRLYRQVELASEERGRLLTQMVERSAHDRRRFAGQLHEQAVSAAASFATLAGAGSTPSTGSALLAEASALVRGELGRHADALRDLVLALRAAGSARPAAQARLATPIAAHVASVYGDGPMPRLTVEIGEGLVLDWVTEAVVLQIVHEAVHNVWRHSQATAVDVTIDVDAGAVRVQVADDGVGFAPADVTEGAGVTSMRSSVAVVGGALSITSTPGTGTVVTAHVQSPSGPLPDPQPAGADPAPVVSLRLVPDLPADPA